jgi:hypothetical protein
MLYRAGFELTTLVVIGTDCIGSYKSNYHTIMTDPNNHIIYSSMVIRDLTLRSAASFGSFHLIRLLYDEYMFYLVEHKVAAATGETPIEFKK